MSKISLNTAFTGLTKLRDWWSVVKSNFIAIATGHNALEDRVDNIVAGAGSSNTEIVDARHSAVKSKDFTVLTDRLEEIETDASSHRADSAISPEQFTGTDFAKVQAALDYALANKVAIKFAKMYDITGNTLLINRAADYLGVDRTQLYLIGEGGGIIKTDAGHIFSAPYADTGDIHVRGLKYESTAGNGTIVWDGDKIIRAKNINNNYRNVDTILSAPTRWTQSMYFINEHITGGSGWKFSAKQYIETTIEHCLIEDVQHGVCNVSVDINYPNAKLRIINNLIENLSGETMKLGGTIGCDISGNYMEINDSYIDLQTLLTGENTHASLTMDNNYFVQTAAQIAASTPCITLGHAATTLAFGGDGISFRGNYVQAGGILLSLGFTTISPYIVASGNTGTVTGTIDKYLNLAPTTIDTGSGATHTKWGNVEKFYNNASATVAASTKGADVTITFDVDILSTDIISFNIANAYGLAILGYGVSSNTVVAFVENYTASEITRIIHCNILRFN